MGTETHCILFQTCPLLPQPGYCWHYIHSNTPWWGCLVPCRISATYAPSYGHKCHVHLRWQASAKFLGNTPTLTDSHHCRLETEEGAGSAHRRMGLFISQFPHSNLLTSSHTVRSTSNLWEAVYDVAEPESSPCKGWVPIHHASRSCH